MINNLYVGNKKYGIKSLIMLLSFLFLNVVKVDAQVSNYCFSQSNGTYTAISGGTSHGSGTGADDAVYSGTIGFTFTFNGSAYTTCNISTNGFITFGATAPATTNYTPIATATAYNGAVSAFARDLVGTASGVVRSQTLGTAPNRTYVIQWSGWARYSGTALADNLNFQIILYETSNKIEIVYGAFTTASTSTTQQVGLRGASNADFNDRTTTTNWATTTLGGTNAVTCTSTNTIKPASGLTFTYSVKPVGPTTTGGSRCGTGTVGLSASGAGAGEDYKWYDALTGGTLLQTGGASYTTPSIAATTTYYVTTYNTVTGCESTPRIPVIASVTASVPAQPSVITGLVSPCSGSSQNYSVTNVAGTTYTWAFPAGWSQTGGGTTNSVTVTTSATSGNITVTPSNGCGAGTARTLAVTPLASPAAPTVTGGTVCGVSGTVSLSASGGSTYNWYNVSSGGSSLGTSSTYTTPTLTSATTYYVAINNGSCDGPRVAVTADIANGGLDTYTASQGAFAYPAALTTAVTSWKNGTNADDNMSTPIPIGFSFPFNGGLEQNVMITTNGLLTFNTATKADGGDIAACGTPEPYTWQNSNFSLSGRLGSLNSIAPFYNDLYCGTSAASGIAANPNANIYYQTTGTAPNRIFKVEWRYMFNDFSDQADCDKTAGSLNFQTWLYETSGNIEFYYGTMTQTAFVDDGSGNCSGSTDNNYTVGINSSTLTATPNTSQLFCQQTANTATFSATAQNNLTTLPTAGTRIVLTRSVPAAPTAVPSTVCSVINNFPANGATNQCLNQILSWAAGDGQPTSYDVYFGTAASPPFVANTTHTYYDPGALAMNTTYYWKIVPKNGVGTGTSSAIWSFSTSVGDIQPTEIISSLGTQIQHIFKGNNALGQPIYENWYEICSGMSGGTLTSIGEQLSTGSEVSWTNPVYFLGWPLVTCTDAIPSSLWGNCNGDTHSPILDFTSWFTAMFNGGYIIYDVFTRGCNGNSPCTRIVLKLTNIPSNGTVANTNETICSGGDPASFGFTALPAGNSSGYTYQWYSAPGNVAAPTGGTIPGGWTNLGAGASGTTTIVTESFGAAPTPPSGWTYTSITANTTCAGSSSPAAEFNATNDRIVTMVYGAAVTNLSFTLGANGAFGCSANISLEASTDGVSWTTVAASINKTVGGFGGCATNTQTFSFTLAQNYRAFRITRIAGGCAATVLTIDDVSITMGAVPSYNPPAGITSTTTYACYIQPIGSNCGQNGWASQEWTVIVNPLPAAPTTSNQTFCASPAPTVANLTATGTNIQWYAASTGGTALPAATALTSGTTYYATQTSATVPACESATRVAALVTINASPTGVTGVWSCPLASNGNRILKVSSTGGTTYNCTGCVGAVPATTNQFYVAPGATAAITALAGSCSSTAVNFTAASAPTVIPSADDYGSCSMWGTNDFVVQSNTTPANGIVVINPQGNDYGLVEAWVYLANTEPLAPGTYNVISTPNDMVALKRRWKIVTQNPSVQSPDVKFNFTNTEFNDAKVQSILNSNPFDDISVNGSNIGATRYKNPGSTENGQFMADNVTLGNVSFFTQTTSDGTMATNTATTLAAAPYVRFNGVPGFSEWWLHASSNLSALPIELLSFEGQKKNGYNALEWITASEKNTDYFTLEGSHDGLDWKIVTDVNSGGFSTQVLNYRFDDYSFTRNSLNYYRLIQTDLDGKSNRVGDVVLIDNRLVNKNIIRMTNILGQDVPSNAKGMLIYIYDDGSQEKVYIE